MASERIPLVPAVMTWARESVGLDVEEAARKIGVSAQVVQRWESGDAEPTIAQARKMAKAYRRPLAVLLLPEPARDFDALRDFRTVDGGRPRVWSYELHTEFRRAVMQRDVALELAEIAPQALPEPAPLPSLQLGSSAEVAGDTLRRFLGKDNRPNRFRTPHEALQFWIAAVEGTGVLVMQTQRIPISEMRGFSIGEWPYPVVALNGSDYPRGRLFTLVHELVHLALNATGLCDLHDGANTSSEPDRVEQFCNRVAASVLMPSADVLGIPEVASASRSKDWLVPELDELSARYSVSSEAMLLRLISLQRASWETYRRRKTDFEDAYLAAKERDRAATGGPSYYTVKARDLGRAYATGVLEAYAGQQISGVDASEFLAVKFSQLGKLHEALR